MKKFSFLVVIMLLVCAGSAYSADHWATTDMSWAEFYAGEVSSTAEQLKADGLDAISTPTTSGLGRFPLLWGQSVDRIGTIISGEKAVQVHMTDEVYEALKDNPRFTFTDTAFSEYKEANSDGTFGKMTTQEDRPSGATVTLATGSSATWGHYVLSVSGAEITIGSANRYCDYYLGAKIETSDGKVYGLRHDNNLWSNTDIAFCINENYTEPHGNGVRRFYEYTRDLEGKTITKITYMLKDRPDVVLDNLNIFVKNQTTATVSAVYPDGMSAYEAHANLPVTLRFANVPSGANYAVSSVYMGSGRNRTPITDYTFENNTLTLNETPAAGNYTVVFSSERYVDISAGFTIFTVDATSLIVSPDNNLASLNFLLTPEGVSDATDSALNTNNFVNASDYTDAKKNFTSAYSSGRNEVENSGFSFDITLEDVPAGKNAIIGFGKIFYLTPSNLGALFSSVYQIVNAMPTGESGYKEANGDTLKSMMLKVINIRADGTKRDVTEFTGAGMMIMNENSILVYYGLMMADCNDGAITEGEYALSDEGETLIADGVKDNHLRAVIYIEALKDDTEVMTEANNKADVEFKTVPAGYIASADNNAEEAKLFWLNEDNVLTGGSSELVTGKTNQISGESGYKFTVPYDTAKIPEGYTAMLGFERVFNFTEENLGSRDYQALRTKVAELPKIPGYDWVMPEDGSTLNSAGIHVMASYPDTGLPDTEVTGLMSYGLLLMDNAVMMDYGAIAVDREITGNEGEIFDMVMEQTPLLSDGKADGKISVSWYITHTQTSDNPIAGFLGSSSGGCNAFYPVLILALIPLIIRKK